MCCFGSFAQYVDNYVDNLWKYKIDVDNFSYNDDITIFVLLYYYIDTIFKK